MTAYVLPIIALAVLPVIVLRDAEQYKTKRPPTHLELWPRPSDKSWGH